jgi:hypothetical protein
MMFGPQLTHGAIPLKLILAELSALLKFIRNFL